MPDPKAVNTMFGRIARRYDAANRILSGGIDRRWRKHLVDNVRRHRPQQILDLATGSGDVAFALSRALEPTTTIIGMDFCQPMLDAAEEKKKAAGSRFPNVKFTLGDGLNIPLPAESQDAVTIAFGLRNLADRPRGLREMRRVLRPGGRLYVLEFSQPYAWFRPLYFLYLRHVLPRIAGLVTGDRAAYDYLHDTIGTFPSRAGLAEEITTAGFSSVRAVALTLGVVALHEAVNAPSRPAAGAVN